MLLLCQGINFVQTVFQQPVFEARLHNVVNRYINNIMNLLLQNQFGKQIIKYAKDSIQLDKEKRAKLRLQNYVNKIKYDNQSQKSKDDNVIKLILNIIVDYLRINDLNYTYTVFLNQSKLKSNQIILTDDLMSILNLTHLNNQKCSVLEILVQQVQKFKKINTTLGTQTIEASKDVYQKLLHDRKLQEIKRELQEIENKNYEFKLEMFKKNEIGKLKADLRQQFKIINEKEMDQKRKQLEKEKMLQKNKQQQFLSSYSKKILQMSQQFQRINKQNSSLKQKLGELQREHKKHDCTKSEKFVLKLNRLGQKQKQLLQLERQYKLAISNTNTRVEDIIEMKEKIISSHKEQQKLLGYQKKRMRLDDQIGQALTNSILNLQKRVQILAQQNSTLNEQKNIKIKKIFYLEKEVSRLHESLISEQDALSRTLIQLDRKAVANNKTIGVTANQEIIAEAFKDEISSEKLQVQAQKQLLEYVDNLYDNKKVFQKNIQKIYFELQCVKRQVRNLVREQQMM